LAETVIKLPTSTFERAGTSSTDARAIRTARRPRPTPLDELRKFGKLAPAEQIVAIRIEPAEERAKVALSRTAHGAEWATGSTTIARPVRTPRSRGAARAVGIARTLCISWPARIARTIRITRPIRIAWAICPSRTVRIAGAIRIPWAIAITTHVAAALVAIPRFSPAVALGVRTALAFGCVTAARFKQVAHFVAQSLETLAHLLAHGLAFFRVQPAIVIFVELP
jgi:hypothetical protein